MQRALQLAGLGRGTVSPNPMVGCVIVANNRIIGEGWHRNYGKAHAEVEAVRNAMARGHSEELVGATAYVTLEPCSHYGKTPPCADLLISKRVGAVVVANEDPNPLVSGRGMARLRDAGIEVVSGVRAEEGALLNRRFFSGIERARPYVILKWAQTRDGYLALPGERTKISNPSVDVIVHKWRAEEDAILVGRQTVQTDNPRLNLRHWAGVNPVRIVLDTNLTTARPGCFVFDGSQPTFFVNREHELLPEGVFNRYAERPETGYPVFYLSGADGTRSLADVLGKFYRLGVASILVEGGGEVLASLLEEGFWDEIRMIQGDKILGRGVKAPRPEGTMTHYEQVQDNTIFYFISPK